MREVVESEAFILALTVLCYYIGLKINDKVRRPFTNPLLISFVLIIPALTLLDIDYETYERGSHLISFLLGPTVVALGYVLHKQIRYIKGNVIAILSTIIVGSVVGVMSVVGVCKLFGTQDDIIISMEPKSVTMPIALGLSERSHGILAMTAIVVFVCGIFGSVVGPWLLKKLKIKSPVARGLAMGAAAHGIGTSRALQMGQIEGAVAGMAMGLMGVMTAIAMPLLEQLWR